MSAAVTFGCRLNLEESAAMRRLAADAGLSHAAIVNTCAVTAEAVRQAGQAIRRLHREDPGRPVVATGCAAQIEPARFAAMPEIAAVLGNAEKLDPAAWRRLANAPAGAPAVEVGDIMAVRAARRLDAAAPRERTRGFVQVQNGCDHRCTFCVIPFGRGNARSVPIAEAVSQVRALSEAGCREVVLTGVDVTSYGRDLGGDAGLGRLVRRILREVPELPRLRLSSLDAVEVDDELRDAFAEEPRLMPHLHLSLQAGDDLLLKRMKRRHSHADAVAFVAGMRRLRPDLVFGADLIAGFPTEDEAMFRRSLELVEACGITWLHAFPFSPRPGTPAARMPQVAPEVVKERAARLRALGARRAEAHLAARIGSTQRVLAEQGGTGRTEGFATVAFAAPPAPGQLLDVAIAGHDGRRLLAA